MILKYPVKNVKIVQEFDFDNSNHPLRGSFYVLFNNKHPGVDFSVPIGTEVTSSFPGICVRKEFHKGMGNVLGIRNGNIVILYSHLSKFKVEKGQTVNYQDLLGFSGDTGNACNEPHLHFEMRDITKPSLKEMVFEPLFNKEIDNIKETFYYTVNNTHTKKTLRQLSSMYFGTEDKWQNIKVANSRLDYNADDILPDRLKVLIPNYCV